MPKMPKMAMPSMPGSKKSLTPAAFVEETTPVEKPSEKTVEVDVEDTESNPAEESKRESQRPKRGILTASFTSAQGQTPRKTEQKKG